MLPCEFSVRLDPVSIQYFYGLFVTQFVDLPGISATLYINQIIYLYVYVGFILLLLCRNCIM